MNIEASPMDVIGSEGTRISILCTVARSTMQHFIFGLVTRLCKCGEQQRDTRERFLVTLPCGHVDTLLGMKVLCVAEKRKKAA